MQPMTIAVSDAELADLRDRLRRTRFPRTSSGPGWERGTDAAYLRELVEYWADEYDWRTHEARLNGYDNQLVEVSGQQLHVVRIPSANTGATPLLLLHGWPGSFVQMLDLAALLPDFDVVIGSLLGFGFSDPPQQAGLAEGGMAELFDALMTEHLGYGAYAAHGTDFGAGVVSELAARHPEHLIAIHIGGTSPRADGITDTDSPELQKYAADVADWRHTEVGYSAIQSTKPDTLATALTDSPAGLASWIVEKFRRWSDCGGDVEQRFSKDQLLTNVMVYWITGSIGSSIAAYAEPADDVDLLNADVPVAHLLSDRDMLHTPREWIARSSRIDHWTQLDRGGHFIEWEEPALVAEDIRDFLVALPARG